LSTHSKNQAKVWPWRNLIKLFGIFYVEEHDRVGINIGVNYAEKKPSTVKKFTAVINHVQT